MVENSASYPRRKWLLGTLNTAVAATLAVIVYPVVRFLFNSVETTFRFYLKLYYRIPGNTESIRPYYIKMKSAVRMQDGQYAAFIMEQLLEHVELSLKNKLGDRRLVRME